MSQCHPDSHDAMERFSLEEFAQLVNRVRMTTDGAHYLGQCPLCGLTLTIRRPVKTKASSSWMIEPTSRRSKRLPLAAGFIGYDLARKRHSRT